MNELQLCITNKCGINCAHCHMSRGADKMSIETAEKCAEQAEKNSIKWIRLTGGDVFEHEKLGEITKIMRKKGLSIILNVSSKKLEQAYKQDFDLLLASFTSIDEIRENKELLKKNAGRTMGCMVFRNEWLSHLRELSALAEEIKLSSLFFLRDTNAKTKQYFMDLNECIERTLQLTKRITFANAFPLCLTAEKNQPYCAGKRFDNGSERLYITTDGSIKKTAYSKETLGRIEQLGSIKTGQKSPGGKCRACKAREHCGGGIDGSDRLAKYSFTNKHPTKLQEEVKKALSANPDADLEKTYFANSDFFMRYIPFEKMGAKKITAEKPDEASIYIHFPFCANKCTFCRIKKISGEKDKYAEELAEEIAKNELIPDKANAVYFGGGSPQLMGRENAEKIFNALFRRLKNPPEEISFELFPAGYDEEMMKFLSAKITRASIGVQCLNSQILSSTGRKAKKEEITSFVKKARAFKKVNIDAIYGLFAGAPEDFEGDFREILELNPDSITLQPLHFLKENTEKEILLNETARRILKEKGYMQASAEDFSKDGKLFEYQKGLLENKNIIGIGRGAFSQINGVHMRTDESGKKTFYRESHDEKMYSHIFFKTRLLKLSINEINKKFGISFKACFSDSLRYLLKKNFAEIKGDELILTEKGRHYADLTANILALSNEDYKK